MCALDHSASAILMLGKDKRDISALTDVRNEFLILYQNLIPQALERARHA